MLKNVTDTVVNTTTKGVYLHRTSFTYSVGTEPKCQYGYGIFEFDATSPTKMWKYVTIECSDPALIRVDVVGNNRIHCATYSNNEPLQIVAFKPNNVDLMNTFHVGDCAVDMRIYDPIVRMVAIADKCMIAEKLIVRADVNNNIPMTIVITVTGYHQYSKPFDF